MTPDLQRDFYLEAQHCFLAIPLQYQSILQCHSCLAGPAPPCLGCPQFVCAVPSAPVQASSDRDGSPSLCCPQA